MMKRTDGMDRLCIYNYILYFLIILRLIYINK